MYSGSNVVKLFGSADDDQSLPPDHSANPENMALGHIKLFRSLQTCHFSDEPEVFSTWVHMLMLCTHKPIKTRLGRKVVTLQPGQFVSGRKQLAQKVGVTEKQMRNIIALFEAEEMLSKDASRAGTVFTILKYAAYQGGDLPENKGQRGANEKGQPEKTPKPLNDKGLSSGSDDGGANAGPAKRATKQENNLTELPKGNSCPGSVPDEPSKVAKVRPDAAVQTREGKKWGTQADLDIARRLADDVARIVGGEKDRRSDQELCDWSNQIRIFRTTPRDSGQYVTHEHMLKIWDFAHENPFWNENLQSPHKLRKHWGKLVLEYKRTKQTQTAGGTTHAAGQPRTEYQRQRAEVDAAINNWQDTSWADDFINNGEI